MYLGGLDVVVEVVSEGLNMRYNIVSSLAGQMPGEKNYSRFSLTFKNYAKLLPKVTYPISPLPESLTPGTF